MENVSSRLRTGGTSEGSNSITVDKRERVDNILSKLGGETEDSEYRLKTDYEHGLNVVGGRLGTWDLCVFGVKRRQVDQKCRKLLSLPQ